MDGLAPWSRQVLAIALLAVIVLTAINLVIVPLTSQAANSIEDLHNARFERAQAEAALARPEPPPIPSVGAQAIRAATADQAQTMFNDLLRRSAAASGTTLAALMPHPAPGRVAIVESDIGIRGSELSVLRMIEALEQGTPIVRFHLWKIAADGASGDGVILQGRVRAAWIRT